MFKVNEYFGGKVKSISFKTAQGPATVGVMAVGEYEFGTSTVEVMTVTSGKLSVILPGSTNWSDYGPGNPFTIAANQKFRVKADEETSYLCLYK
jgi:purine/pyrimidine-nucleoside phosphorylase